MSALLWGLGLIVLLACAWVARYDTKGGTSSKSDWDVHP